MRNRDERLAKQHEYYIANRDDILAKVRERRSAEMQAKPQKVKFKYDVERRRAYHREWYRKNRCKKNETTANIQTQAADARLIQTQNGTPANHTDAAKTAESHRTGIAV